MLLKKLDELELVAGERGSKPDITAVTESWTNSDIPDASLSLRRYSLFRKDRIDIKNGRGRGILMLAEAELKL